MPLPDVHVFTDGSCLGNPGAGGYAALLRFGSAEKVLTGHEPYTTNNRMELMAVIVALKALTKPCRVHLYTDSQYVRQGITDWIHRWKINGWRNASGQSIKNIDLWKVLDNLVITHDIQWHWVKGHSNHVENERVDKLARDAAKTLAP